jgi:group I intron endonuclease
MITYKATNTRNGKFYIGSAVDFDKRKQQHLRSALNYPFQNALRQSPDSFEWEIVEDDSDEPILEQALLDMWFGTEMCYNLNPRADRPPSWKGKSHKVETLEKMRETAKLRPGTTSEQARRGVETRIKNGTIYPSDETREKMRIAHTGKTHSLESREKRSKALKGRVNESAKGSKWWTSMETGETRMLHEDPGDGWVPGRKLK